MCMYVFALASNKFQQNQLRVKSVKKKKKIIELLKCDCK
jgi:hypothetical protein